MEQVAILARVSTQGQDYERQVVELTDYCQRMNWKVTKVFANKVSGAVKLADREEITALVEYVKEHPRTAHRHKNLFARPGTPGRQKGQIGSRGEEDTGRDILYAFVPTLPALWQYRLWVVQQGTEQAIRLLSLQLLRELPDFCRGC